MAEAGAVDTSEHDCLEGLAKLYLLGLID